MSETPVVVVDNLRYRYPRQDRLALDGISFEAKRGEFIGVVGPNGSGKTTLSHALVGLVPHFYKGAIGGRVIVTDVDVHATTVAETSRRVGLVFQNPFTQMTGAKLTVYDEVAFGLEYSGVSRDVMKARIERALQRLGLWALRDRHPFALSGGQMQRLAIASVLAMDPEVLVLDEPTSQLDPAGTREVFDAVMDLCADGMTVIMAEHEIEGLAARAHRILVLDGGRMVDLDTPRAVFGRLAKAWAGDLPRRSPTGAPATAPGHPPVPVPAPTAVAAALDWRSPDGALPITVDEGVAAGRIRLAGAATAQRFAGARPLEPKTEDAPADPLVQVRDVRFHYTADTPVLKGISLDLGPGGTAIVGQNGAGKSTFVRLLNGLLKPVQGDVYIRGVNTRAATVASLARTVGLVFQNPSDQLFKSNVLDEVMFGPLNLGFSRDEAHARALDALERVGLAFATRRNPYDLGLAERKLVTIAGVLAMDTDVIILDEPTIAQDASGVARLGALVDGLQAAGRTVIAITHDMDFVARHFQRRVLVFYDGRVLADGPAREIFAQPSVLAQAALEAPSITALSQGLGLGPALTTDELIQQLRAVPSD